MASAMVLAKGVDHCRADDDADRIPLDNVNRKHTFASGLDLVLVLITALTIISRAR